MNGSLGHLLMTGFQLSGAIQVYILATHFICLLDDELKALSTNKFACRYLLTCLSLSVGSVVALLPIINRMYLI